MFAFDSYNLRSLRSEMSGFRDEFGKHPEAGLAEHTDAQGLTRVFIPDAAIGPRVVNEGNTIRSFAPNGTF